jgi:hypothetical protein
MAALMLSVFAASAHAAGRDVLETRKGERFLGTAWLETQPPSGESDTGKPAVAPRHAATRQTSVSLQSAYGQFSLASDKIFRITGLGETYLRQLVVMHDGEAFSGRLDSQTVRLELPNGQVMHVPLSQVKSIEFHPDSPSQPASSGDSKSFQPLALLRSGDSLFIAPPTAPVKVTTRYGTIDLAPAAINEIVFHKTDGGDPDMYIFTLVDGSIFGGLVANDTWSFDLIGAAGKQTVSIPTGNLTRLLLNERASRTPSTAPTTAPVPGQLKLANDDMLMGQLNGPLVLDTAFDPVSLDPAELSSLNRSDETHAISVKLWDGTAVAGDLSQPAVEFQLSLGGTLQIPVALLRSYTQSAPRIPQRVKDQVKQLVEKLGTSEGDSARSQLSAMGSKINPLLDEIRAASSKETQKQIDAFRGVKN